MSSNPLMTFKDEILTKIIKPKLVILINEGAQSISDLHTKFRKEFKTTVSSREFRNWCEFLGLEPTTQVRWKTATNPVMGMTQDTFDSIDDEKSLEFLQEEFSFDNEA